MTHDHTQPLSAEADHFSFCGQSCRLLYKEMGMQSALTYLFAYLRQYYSLSRIFCGFRHYKSTTFVPVADTLGGISRSVMALATSALSAEQIGQLMGTDAFEPYLMHSSPFLDRSQMMLRQEDFVCYLRIPLFTQGESTFQMAFCSNEEHAFCKEDGELFFRITRPLGEAMGEEFQGGSTPRLIAAAGAERLHLLQMCKGLTELRHEVQKIAPTECTVLVHGPTGSGKEVVVDTLHACSDRAKGPLIKVNCGAIADTLLESELFGHEKGAFTGANQGRAGYFEAANGGTLFLDEIGELPPRMQVGLLRVLDNHEVTRVGGTRTIPLNVRILAATHKDLQTMVDEGQFREDLWYRLNVYTLRVPPLREHKMDIPVLVHHFVNGLVGSMRLVHPPHISDTQMEELCAHDWPGNIRELRHVVEHAAVRARQGNTCGPLNFSPVLLELRNRRTRKTASDAGAPLDSASFAAMAGQSQFSGLPLPPGLPQLPCLAHIAQTGKLPTLSCWADEYILWVLHRAGGKITGMTGAAHILGLHPNTLRTRRDRALSGAGSSIKRG